MIDKYIIHADRAKIALKYNAASKEGIIGGNSHFRLLIEGLIVDYLDISIPKMHNTQVNKIRYHFRLSNEKFKSVLDKLEEHSITTEKVKSLGRIMN